MGTSDDPYFAEVGESLTGRKAGDSARSKARELAAVRPLSSVASRILRLPSEEGRWRKGAFGERVAGFYLHRLPEGWHTFNDVPVGDRGANIDHVVVGPAGVFTVNTKNISGKVVVTSRHVRVDGYSREYYPKAVHEARRASRLLTAALSRPVAVTGVVCIIADEWVIKGQPADVHVSKAPGIKKWLLSLPTTLTPRDVIEIAGVAHKPSTWTTRTPATADPASRPLQTFAGDPCSCGGTFVLRHRKKDGGPFLGCSRFPACRRIRALG
jgi:hypothetical protein